MLTVRYLGFKEGSFPMLNLSEDEREIIRSTWAGVVVSRSVAAELFYGRLFQINPETRSLFSQNMEEQGRKLIATINVVVDNLEEDLGETVLALGQRHQDYNVVEADYSKVASALLWMLERMNNGTFPEQAKLAWTKAYEQLVATMLEGYRTP